MTDTAQRIVRLEPPRRPERVIELDAMHAVGDAARPLSIPERLLQITGVRRLIVVVVLCLAWQLYAMWLNNNLLFPTLGETLEALYDAVVNGPLVQRTLTSLQILLTGYAAEKVQTNPPTFGPSTVTRYHNAPRLRELAEKVVAGLGISGIIGSVSAGVPGRPYAANGTHPRPITTSGSRARFNCLPAVAKPVATGGCACTTDLMSGRSP